MVLHMQATISIEIVKEGPQRNFDTGIPKILGNGKEQEFSYEVDF